MCGIIGIIDANRAYNCRSFVEEGLSKLKYRGPDDKGLEFLEYEGNRIWFGHRRLSIIDLSDKARQPFEDNGIMIVFNGEIYNYQKLRKQLQSVGEKFESNSDTEVILKGYKHYGIDYINQLNGMFSIAVVNKAMNELFLVRDRTGVKPLYYTANKNLIAFCSESNIIAELIGKDIDEDAFSYYMRVGYVPGALSMFKGVKKVLPGTLIRVCLRTFALKETPYYNIPIVAAPNRYTPNDIFNDVKGSICNNMVSDVEVGSFLSGGLDSSIITSVASLHNTNLTSFTTRFTTDDDYNKFNTDYEMAKLLAGHLNIKLEVVDIKDDDLSLMDSFYDYSSSLDEPQANLTGFSTYLIAKKANEMGIKVLLSGDGADEVFGGYNRYRLLMKMLKYAPLSYMHPKSWRYLFNSNFDKYINLTSVLTEKQSNKVVSSTRKLAPIFGSTNHISDTVENINYYDLLYWIPDESNKRVDRASMLNSVEVRVPFQDHELIDKYFNIPLKSKITNNNEKIMLKEAFKSLIPGQIMNRKKTGWNAPDSKWFRSFLKPLLEEQLSHDSLSRHSLFNEKYVTRILDEHMQGMYYRQELKTILPFQIWYNNNF